VAPEGKQLVVAGKTQDTAWRLEERLSLPQKRKTLLYGQVLIGTRRIFLCHPATRELRSWDKGCRIISETFGWIFHLSHGHMKRKEFTAFLGNGTANKSSSASSNKTGHRILLGKRNLLERECRRHRLFYGNAMALV
jgi:hypothetical protein